MNWLELEYLGNPLALWAVAAAATVLTFVGLEGGKGFVSRRLARLAGRTDNEVDDIAVLMLRATKAITLAVVALYVGALFVAVPPQADRLVALALTVLLTIQGGLWGNVVISAWLAKRFGPGLAVGDVAGEAGQAMTVRGTGYGALGFIARLILWSVLLLMALDNLGIEVKTLVAGLGVGGIAVALAVQNILGDIFCSLSIILDKPFEVGDFIIVGDQRGTVESIGIKTTRLLSLRGEQVVFSNSDLVNSRIQNFKKMKERRVLTTFGVTYQTPSEKLERIPGIITGLIDGVDNARIERVHFHSYGDSALIFEMVYYVSSPDYVAYMDIQQDINLAMYKAFEGEGVDFAYPTQTLYLHQES